MHPNAISEIIESNIFFFRPIHPGGLFREVCSELPARSLAVNWVGAVIRAGALCIPRVVVVVVIWRLGKRLLERKDYRGAWRCFLCRWVLVRITCRAGSKLMIDWKGQWLSVGELFRWKNGKEMNAAALMGTVGSMLTQWYSQGGKSRRRHGWVTRKIPL